MPIVFVHGVGVRDEAAWLSTRAFLRRYIAPVISCDADKVQILQAYWGDLGVRFAWNGASRPRAPLTGQGAELDPSPLDEASALLAVDERTVNYSETAEPAYTSELAPMGPRRGGSSSSGRKLEIAALSPDELSDLFSQAVANDDSASQADRTRMVIAVDDVAHDGKTLAEMAKLNTLDEQIQLLQQRLKDRLDADAEVAGMGVPTWMQKTVDRVREAASRTGGIPGFVLARGVAEFRRPLNDQVTTFIGDVFVYLNSRRDAKGTRGAIPTRVLDTLQEARRAPGGPSDEPLVVVTHSMGGQIIYDLVTTFIPEARSAGESIPRIDFWCATASQVGLFEEAKLFLASDDSIKADAAESIVSFPDRSVLGGWWNVWDHTDFISYTVQEIIAGVDDGAFTAGQLQAHSGYLARPSFYRRFGEKLASARKQNWWRP
jgi:hypothetical protein